MVELPVALPVELVALVELVLFEPDPTTGLVGFLEVEVDGFLVPTAGFLMVSLTFPVPTEGLVLPPPTDGFPPPLPDPEPEPEPDPEPEPEPDPEPDPPEPAEGIQLRAEFPNKFIQPAA